MLSTCLSSSALFRVACEPASTCVAIHVCVVLKKGCLSSSSFCLLGARRSPSIGPMVVAELLRWRVPLALVLSIVLMGFNEKLLHREDTGIMLSIRFAWDGRQMF